MSNIEKPEAARKYEIYTKASEIVSTNWTRGALADKNNFSGEYNFCAMGAVQRAKGHSAYNVDTVGNLSNKEAKEVCRVLRRYPIYWAGVVLSLFNHNAKYTTRIIFWNDIFWRRQKTVSKAFERLAATFEPEYTTWQINLQENIVTQQRIRIIQLEAELSELRSRIARLEKENEHLWSRLMNRRQLKTDNEVLAALEAEFETVSSGL